jgi:hypothetical protein
MKVQSIENDDGTVVPSGDEHDVETRTCRLSLHQSIDYLGYSVVWW